MGTIIGNTIKLQLSGVANRGYIGPVGTEQEFVSGAFSVDVSDYALTLYGSSGNGGTLANLFMTFTDLGNLPDITWVGVTAGSALPFTWDANSITFDMSSIALPPGIVFQLGIGFSPTDISLSNATISDNATGPVVVGTLSNDDFDGTTRTYTIANNPYFTLDGNKIVLKTGVSLDYETITSYDVTVTATDTSGAKHAVTETFTIAIQDVNDRPSVTATGLESTFTENGAAVDLFSGVSIGTVEAGQLIRSVVLTVSGLDSEGNSDWLAIDGANVALVNGTAGSTFSLGIYYSVSRSGNVATVTIVSSGGLTVAQAEQLIDRLSYINVGNDPGGTDRTITLVSIQDNGGTDNGGTDTTAVNLASTVHVVPVNDAPDGADKTISITEDATYTFSAADFGFSDRLDGDSFLALKIVTLPVSGTLHLADTSGGSAAPTVVQAGDEVQADHVQFLTWTPGANENGSGRASFTFQVVDSGDSANGGNVDLTPNRIVFDVTAVNDAPDFVAGASQTVDEDSGAHTVTGWATAISAGHADEAGQALTFTVTNDNNGLFAVQPNIAADGTLTYTLADDANGEAMVTVVLSDNGGTADGGKDISSPVSFLITAEAVNDRPTAIDITPVAQNTDKSFVLAENRAGAAIGTVVTTDRDDTSFTYTIDDARFEVVGDQLKLKSGVALDYEAAHTVTIKVTAADSGGLTVSRDISIIVADDGADNNSAPLLSSPNADTTVQPGATLSLSIGDGHFIDPDGTDLDYAITVNGGAQPAWLSFDAETGLLTGTPSGADAGTYVIAVTASDGSLSSVTDTFDLIVANPANPPDTTGTRGNDRLSGDDADNLMDGRGGNDRLTGNGGGDTFVFGKHYGRDVILDFNPDEGDRIDLSDAVGIRGFQDLIRNHLFDTGDDLKIRADDGSVLIIRGIEPDELTKDMFQF
jgi:hypothetical protein